MGRHATVAGRMAASAAARGRLFTRLAREIMVSARQGTDPEANSRLRLAVDRARDNNMPKDNIERAIKKGAGELGAAHYEEGAYEGYGPGGSAIVVEVLTDNRNRTIPEIRRLFQKGGGTMGEMGSVSWMFKKMGVFLIKLEGISEEQVMQIALDAGAEDVQVEDGFATVYSEMSLYSAVRNAFIEQKIGFEKSGLEMVPQNTVAVPAENQETLEALLEALEGHDDVQNVFHNALFAD